MFFTDLLIIGLGLVLIAFIATQVIIPILDNKPLFPVLLKDSHKLETQLAEAKAETDRAAVKQQIAAERNKANRATTKPKARQ